MDSIIIFCAKYLIFIVGLLALGYWFTLPKKQKVEIVIYGIITGIIAFILAKLSGIVFNDPRPFISDHVTALFSYTADNGFPSDHTLVTAAIAATVFSVSKKWGIGLLVLSVIIGTSRVLAHVHHPIDIAGSLVFAAIGALVAYYLTPLISSQIGESKYGKKLGYHGSSQSENTVTKS